MASVVPRWRRQKRFSSRSRQSSTSRSPSAARGKKRSSSATPSHHASKRKWPSCETLSGSSSNGRIYGTKSLSTGSFNREPSLQCHQIQKRSSSDTLSRSLSQQEIDGYEPKIGPVHTRKWMSTESMSASEKTAKHIFASHFSSCVPSDTKSKSKHKARKRFLSQSLSRNDRELDITYKSTGRDRKKAHSEVKEKVDSDVKFKKLKDDTNQTAPKSKSRKRTISPNSSTSLGSAKQYKFEACVRSRLPIDVSQLSSLRFRLLILLVTA